MRGPFERIDTPKGFTVGATKYAAIHYHKDNGMYEEWLVDTGRKQPEDLSNKLAVQLGLYTEDFNAQWYEKQTGIEFADMTQWKKIWRDKPEIEFQHRDHPFLNTHPDRVYADPTTAEIVLVDCKHTNINNYSGGYNRNKFIERYEPQMQMQMFAASSALGVDVKRSELSVIYGNSYWDKIEIEAQPLRQMEIFKELQQYVHFVINDIEPPHTAAEEITKQKVAATEILDWDESNEDNLGSNTAIEWSVLREAYLKTKVDHTAHEIVKKNAKAFMPETAQRAGCANLWMERNRAGHIMFKEKKEKVRHG